MKMEIYTLYDNVKCEMGGMLMYKNKNDAMRAAEHMYSTLGPDSVAKREDFTLFRIGEIETESATGSLYKPEKIIPNLGEE